MNKRLIVQYAVQCLEALDHPVIPILSAEDLSRRQGVPLTDCQSILRRLDQAGIIELRPDGGIFLRRHLDELTSLELLSALWDPVVQPPAFQMWMGGHQGRRMQTTLNYVRASSDGADWRIQ